MHYILYNKFNYRRLMISYLFKKTYDKVLFYLLLTNITDRVSPNRGKLSYLTSLGTVM